MARQHLRGLLGWGLGSLCTSGTVKLPGGTPTAIAGSMAKRLFLQVLCVGGRGLVKGAHQAEADNLGNITAYLIVAARVDFKGLLMR